LLIVLILRLAVASVIMSNEPFALSPVTPPSTPPSESEYEAICATVMESARGRWFLSEFARRNRHADTRLVVDAISRLEAAIRGDQAPPVDHLRSALSDMAEAIARAKADIAAIKSSDQQEGKIIEASEELDSIVDATEHATSTILAAAEHVQEIAWTMREQDIHARYCDELDAEATAIYTACSFQDLTGQRTHKVVQVMRYIEGRINALADVWGDLAKPAPPKAKPQAATNGHDSIEMEAQAERAPGGVGADDSGTDDLVGANDLDPDEGQTTLPPAGGNPAAYLELEPLIPSRGRDGDQPDTPHAVFVSTDPAAVATNLDSGDIQAETIAPTPEPVDTALAEPEQIDIATLIEPAATPVDEAAEVEREQVPTVSMLEARGAQASAPWRIETENGDEVPTVSMLEAAVQRLATETDAGHPPQAPLALDPALAPQAEALPAAAPIDAEATREEIVAAIDAEAEALLHGSESDPDKQRGATILVLPSAAGPVAATFVRESTVGQASTEQAKRAQEADGIPPIEITSAAAGPKAARASETNDRAAAVRPAEALATTEANLPGELAAPEQGRGVGPIKIDPPFADDDAQLHPPSPAPSADADAEERVTARVAAEPTPAGIEREPGDAPPPVQLKPEAPEAATGSVPKPEFVRGPTDTSENELAELLFEPAREPSAPISLPNVLPVVQFENSSSAESPKSLAQIGPKVETTAPAPLQSVDQGSGSNVAPKAAALNGIRNEALSAVAAAASPAPRGPTQQSPQRPMARPASNDPLAAILALSEEEKIALFS
jgi:chemotaxis protein CheZ